jgi:PLP dependent protein
MPTAWPMWRSTVPTGESWRDVESMLSREQISANLEVVKTRIAAACARAGRDATGVTLVAVTKTFGSEAPTAAIAAGATAIGENRVQEARDKKPAVVGAARWHLIGHLQSNKARDAVRLFDVIETIDSLELAQKVANAAVMEGKRQEVLLEVNIGREAQKTGADPDEVVSLAKQIAGIDGLSLRGLMAIPPHGTPEETRPWFRELRKLCTAAALPELSMGMTEDFEVAIEEGATIVRVGRAIFGERG